MRRKYLLLLLSLAMGSLMYAQSPHSVSLQSVLRDGTGRLVTNQNVSVRLTITRGTATGTLVYVETHQTTTSPYGLYNVLLGQGTPMSGAFGTIDWGNGPYYLTADADPTGGNNYTLSVVQPLVSVPYALFADTAAHVAQATMADNATQSVYADTAYYTIMADTARYFCEQQVLSIGHDTIYLTGGSYVVLPAGFSGDYNDLSNLPTLFSGDYNDLTNQPAIPTVPTNVSAFTNDAGYLTSFTEQQVLSIGHDTIYLTGGSYVVLPPSETSMTIRNYVDSVVNANNTTTVTNNIQNQISDSLQNLYSNMRDWVMTIIQDSISTLREQILGSMCIPSCESFDSLRRVNDSLIHVIDSITNINPPCTGLATSSDENITACDSYTWIDGNTYTASTTATHTLAGANAAGCDSTVTLHLTVIHPQHEAFTETACESYTWNNTNYTTSGDYTFSHADANNCIQVDTLHLTINLGTYTAESHTAESSYEWHGTTYTATGDYTYSYTNAEGCPSVDTLHLTITTGGCGWVDLGLPSGLLWYSCNVGASSPEDYGDYFAWGETQPKSYYDWSTYAYCHGSGTTFTKYCTQSSYGYRGFTDNRSTLQARDDAARAHLGNEARIPTRTEWEELLNNTIITWSTRNGVYGRLFTAPNGNSLFLPSSGAFWPDGLFSDGTTGHYWAASLDTAQPEYAFICSFGHSGQQVTRSDRCLGLSVRAVRSAY